jgi:isoamylase
VAVRPVDGGDHDNDSWDQGGGGGPAQGRAQRHGADDAERRHPMITGGDEFLRTLQWQQQPVQPRLRGELAELDSWSTTQTNFRTFTQRLISFRKAHPALRPVNFYSGSDTNGNVMEQLRWFKPGGQVPDASYFTTRTTTRSPGGSTAPSSATLPQRDLRRLQRLVGNVNFTLPWPGNGRTWYRVTDTCSWAEGSGQFELPGQEDLIGGEWTNYGLCGRGLLLLIAR